MRWLVFILCGTVAATGCGGGDPWGFTEGGDEPVLLEIAGDQLHPFIDGRTLAWFDLEGDPNGACFVPSYDPEGNCDTTCDGVVRTLDLLTGRVRTVSEVTGHEAMPVVTDGLVVWRCNRDGGQGLCVSPVDHPEVRFHPGLGTYSYDWQDFATRPAVAGGKVVWAAYRDDSYNPIFRITRADLRTGAEEVVTYLERFPAWVACSEGRIAWISQFWDQGQHNRLEVLDPESGEQTVLVDTADASLFGLAVDGDLVAWKQTVAIEGGLEVQVRYRQAGGPIRRADGPDARVSSETPVVAAAGRLAWLDHREGDYRVALFDPRDGTEELVSPPEATIGAYATPALADGWIAFSDMRRGQWDLLVVPR